MAGRFYANQLSAIGRFTENGDWDIRLLPGLAVYVCMSLAIEVFIFRNDSVKGMGSALSHGALLGFIIYGVFDFTNRAILAEYPLSMVVIDILWGSALFTAVTYLNFQLRSRLTFL